MPWECLNEVILEGVVVKEPIYRETPMGRMITDVIIAVNRPYNKADYIPCICWGKHARYAANLDVGDVLKLKGRIQSRDYVKHMDNGDMIVKTAYEVSVFAIDDRGGK